jgi:hypothetical protein
MYISTSSLDNRRRTITRRIGVWSDNKAGSSGNNELKLIDLQTNSDTIRIFYTNKARGVAKVADSVRVELNGVSTTYSNTARVIVGPFRINIFKDARQVLNFEIGWNTINNIISLKGAIVVVLKRIAARNGRLWNGGSGSRWDGFGKAGSSYGLSRSNFETGVGAQSVNPADELFVSSDEAEFIALLADADNSENLLSVQEGNIFDDFPDQGEDGEGNNAPVLEWDDTMPSLVSILDNENGLEDIVDQVLAYGSASGQWYKEIP